MENAYGTVTERYQNGDRMIKELLIKRIENGTVTKWYRNFCTATDRDLHGVLRAEMGVSVDTML